MYSSFHSTIRYSVRHLSHKWTIEWHVEDEVDERRRGRDILRIERWLKGNRMRRTESRTSFSSHWHCPIVLECDRFRGHNHDRPSYRMGRSTSCTHATSTLQWQQTSLDARSWMNSPPVAFKSSYADSVIVWFHSVWKENLNWTIRIVN